jgi:integrase
MPAINMTRLSEELLAIYAPPHRRIATTRKMGQLLRELRELGATSSADLTPQLVARWVSAHPERKPISNHSLLISFRAACTYAKKSGYLRMSPWEIRKDWLPLEDDDEDEQLPTRHLSIAEVQAILGQAATEAMAGGFEARRLHALVATYAYCGLRKMEALGLKLTDVDFQSGVIRLRSRRRHRFKTRSSAAPVPLPPELGTILRRWIDTRSVDSEWLFPGVRGKAPWTGGSPGRKPLDCVQALASRAGVAGVTIKCFRNSLATHMKRWGFGPLAVRDVLRHTDVSTQEHYLESDMDDLRYIAGRISYRTGT